MKKVTGCYVVKKKKPLGQLYPRLTYQRVEVSDVLRCRGRRPQRSQQLHSYRTGSIGRAVIIICYLQLSGS